MNAGSCTPLRATDEQDPAFKSAEDQCKQVATQSSTWKSDAETAKANLAKIDEIGQHLVGNVENRVVWLELLRAVNECLPHEEEDEAAPPAADGAEAAAEATEKPRKPIMERNELHITSFECQRLPSAGFWISAVKKSGWYQKSEEELAAEAAQKAAAGGGMGGDAMGGDATGMGGGAPGMGGPGMGGPGMGGPGMGGPGMGGPGMGGPGMGGPGMGGPGMGMDSGMGGPGMGMDSGMGMDGGAVTAQKDVWIIQLEGYHYHNGEKASVDQGAQYVRDTLIRNLQEMEVYLPTGNKEDGEEGKQKTELVTMQELGISYPVLINPGGIIEVQVVDRDAEADASEGAAAGARPRGAGMGGGEMGMGGPGMGGAGMGGPGMGGAGMGGMQNRKMIKLRRFDFKVQFCWHPTPPTVRHEKKKKQEEAKAETGQFGDEMPGVNP